MRERRSASDLRRAREFDAFAAGAAGRLLRTAALLTAEPPGATPRAQRLLVASLARTYAEWGRLRDADPYDHTRRDLALRFAHGAWRARWTERDGAGGTAARSQENRPPYPRSPLGSLTPQERLVLVLRLHEGLAEEQTASLLGLPEDRIRALCARAMAALREGARPPRVPRSGTGSREAGR
ncbi:sigma factor-like helix-turn-helix DNA-binding protein [Streptomyces sp. NPDC093085]|uniref:sigma factor-like helix-turn-helix DNA-binding protein n=1 Tax=Streptomyces sp. NPDC093085 TaxID=3155068 RepID=UPI003442093A